MKQLVLLLSTFLFCSTYAQEIENIRSYQLGDKIRVTYDILGGHPEDTYDVELFASINGRPPIALENISGDVGRSVPGGIRKTIVWDVLEEVDYLESVSFTIKARERFVQRPSRNDQIVIRSKEPCSKKSEVYVYKSRPSSSGSYDPRIYVPRSSKGNSSIVITKPDVQVRTRVYSPKSDDCDTKEKKETKVYVYQSKPKEKPSVRHYTPRPDSHSKSKSSSHSYSYSKSPSPSPSPSKDYKSKKRVRNSKGFFVTYNASESMPYGFRVGKLKGLSPYFAARIGTGHEFETEPFSSGSFTVGATLRVLRISSMKAHLYGGVGYARYAESSFLDGGPITSRSGYLDGVEFEYGGIVTLGRLTLSLGTAFLEDFRQPELTYGIGITFGKNY